VAQTEVIVTAAHELDAIKQTLLAGLRVRLTPEQGVEAFARHQLLAIRFHRAARLSERSSYREGQGWCRFFADHFPRGDANALLLWEHWRVPLLKDEMPGAGVVITHRQPWLHWRMTDRGLAVDLESMWDDFERAVDTFIASLAASPERRRVAVRRWRERSWAVQPVNVVAPGLQVTVSAASASTSATAMVPPRS
jgi:hypothetical protein